MSQKIIKILIDQKVPLRSLTQEERLVGKNVMQNNLRVKPHERVTIITDTIKAMEEAVIFYEAAKSFTDKVTFVETEPATENAQEPPKTIQSEMNKADVAILVTTYSLSHTHAVTKARSHGTRIASMPGITHEVIMRTLSISYDEIARLSKDIAAILTGGNQALLTSNNGTEIIFDLSGRNAHIDTGLLTNPSDWGNLPAGEAFIAPVEGKSQGILVFDGAFADIKIDEPILVTIENGKAVDIKGGEGAGLLSERLSRVGKRGYNIAELGVGTNKMARLDSTLLEVEKVYETVHVAIGNNAHIGGEVDVPFHSDGVILKPTLTVDDTVILKAGKFQL